MFGKDVMVRVIDTDRYKRTVGIIMLGETDVNLEMVRLGYAWVYRVKLWFLSLPSEDVAISRVAERVIQGGHNIPEQIVRRRFKSGLENFHERYSKVFDSWAFFDNSGPEPKLIEWGVK